MITAQQINDFEFLEAIQDAIDNGFGRTSTPLRLKFVELMAKQEPVSLDSSALFEQARNMPVEDLHKLINEVCAGWTRSELRTIYRKRKEKGE